MREQISESFAKLSASSARRQPEVLSSLGRLLGMEVDDLRVWLEHVHGRTKLHNALGRLWPAVPDEPRERLEMPAELGEKRNTDARRDPAVQLRLAQILGASLAVVEAALSEEHHRLRLDRCLFETCEQAYLAAVGRRGGQAAKPTGNHRIAKAEVELAPAQTGVSSPTIYAKTADSQPNSNAQDAGLGYSVKRIAPLPSVFPEPSVTKPTVRPPRSDLSLMPGMQVRARG